VQLVVTTQPSSAKHGAASVAHSPQLRAQSARTLGAKEEAEQYPAAAYAPQSDARSAHAASTEATTPLISTGRYAHSEFLAGA
jgi:hypothetical protein